MCGDDFLYVFMGEGVVVESDVVYIIYFGWEVCGDVVLCSVVGCV